MIKLEHVGICAKDTTALKDWYIKLFCFKTVYDNKKEVPTYFLLIEDNSMLEFYPAEEHTDKCSNKYSGIRHLSFGTDDIERDYEILKSNNVEIIDDLKSGSNGVKTVFFRDPEGNIIHFIQRVKELY